MDVAYAFTAAENFVGTIGADVKSTLGSGVKAVRDIAVTAWDSLRAAISQIFDSVVSAFKKLWEDRPFLIIGAGVIAVLTIGTWAPILLQILKNVPVAVMQVLKAPLALIGLVRR